MNLETADKVIAWGLPIIGIVTAGVWVASDINTRVTAMEARVSALENRSAPGTKIGDLCAKLLEGYARANPQTIANIEKQLDRSGCYNDVPANATAPQDELGASGSN